MNHLSQSWKIDRTRKVSVLSSRKDRASAKVYPAITKAGILAKAQKQLSFIAPSINPDKSGILGSLAFPFRDVLKGTPLENVPGSVLSACCGKNNYTVKVKKDKGRCIKQQRRQFLQNHTLAKELTDMGSRTLNPLKTELLIVQMFPQLKKENYSDNTAEALAENSAVRYFGICLKNLQTT